MRINDVKIKLLMLMMLKSKEKNSLKFLGDMIDENLTWKTHVELVENKISKSVIHMSILHGLVLTKPI